MQGSKENPKHIQAMKDGKAPLEYLVDFVMTGDAYVHKGGADKYGFRNWTIDSIKASTYIAAIRRHLKAWSEGEDLDPDSGWSHLYHIRAGCAIVLDADNAGTLIDDRDRAESISQEKAAEVAPEKPLSDFPKPGVPAPRKLGVAHGQFSNWEAALIDLCRDLGYRAMQHPENTQKMIDSIINKQ